MSQMQTVKLSITERSSQEFAHIVDIAALSSKDVLQVEKDGHSYRAAALRAYHADQEAGQVDLEFDRLALEVLSVDQADAYACLTAIIRAPWAKLQVHEGLYGEAVFLMPKPKA